MRTCIEILLLEYIFSLIFTREFGVVCAREGGANTTPFQVAHFALRNTPKNSGEKEAGKGGAEFPPDSPSAPPALRSRAWGGKRLRHSVISRISKQKNFLFLLKEKRAREKIKKCRENFPVLLSRFVGWAETLGGFLAVHGRNCCSKKVRASFSNCDHTKLDGFCGEFDCSYRVIPALSGSMLNFIL